MARWRHEDFWKISMSGFWDGWVLCLIGLVCFGLSVVSNSCDPRDCSLPGSSVHVILQARILEWAAMPSSRGSSRPGDWTLVSCLVSRSLPLSHQGGRADWNRSLNPRATAREGGPGCHPPCLPWGPPSDRRPECEICKSLLKTPRGINTWCELNCVPQKGVCWNPKPPASQNVRSLQR